MAAMIAPFTTEDTFPTHDAKYGKGGYRSVDTIAERDAIPAARLTDGCVCYVSADQNEYRYNATTASWTKIEKGGGGGSSVTVVDNLDSTSPTDALSANQGRELGKRTADLEHKIGKYKVVVPEYGSIFIGDQDFDGNTIVKVTEQVIIMGVDKTPYEVVLDVAPNVEVFMDDGIPTIGEVDNSKRRIYSFLNGTLVIGNFE